MIGNNDSLRIDQEPDSNDLGILVEVEVPDVDMDHKLSEDSTQERTGEMATFTPTQKLLCPEYFENHDPISKTQEIQFDLLQRLRAECQDL